MILKLKMEAPDTWANGQGKELAVALANFANAGNMDSERFNRLG